MIKDWLYFARWIFLVIALIYACHYLPNVKMVGALIQLKLNAGAALAKYYKAANEN